MSRAVIRHLAGAVIVITYAAALGAAAELHVSPGGDDAHPGTSAAPLRTIAKAAELAQPGDVITVHEGDYREQIAPPRGGLSDEKRIVYQAAPGEKVAIKGSEIVKNWEKVQNDTWKATVPNSLFGGFNPYSDLIRGDWFEPKQRQHHTGAVYLNGEWLVEAVKLEDVLLPYNAAAPGYLGGTGSVLLNVAWLRPGQENSSAGRIPATSFAERLGTRNAPCSEGGECVGWIEHGHWLLYPAVDFGEGTDLLTIRAASATSGGIIELRLGGPDGELLGSGTVPNTGGWQSWTSFPVKVKPTSGVQKLCLRFRDKEPAQDMPGLWFAQVDDEKTTIHAQFPGCDPNEQLAEINVRRAVFYPEKPGVDYITVRGFQMRHAATPWAPPTAEQIALIGTHWSKGWIIENNEISHSICSGVALGKYGDEFDNTSANTAEGYVKTIERAHAFAIPWTRENIGHHIVRNNTISHCEQAGIVGSLGAAFSMVTGNTIHDIHVRRLFTGAEMAGIKFHAAIDTTISNNHIHRTVLGLWLDWMAQGTRVSGNLFHDNATDLFVEVDHGPFLVDNNLFLSGVSLNDMSEGGAYAHNLFAGRLLSRPEQGRETPYHPAHTTVVAGLTTIKGGDDRFYNNIFLGDGSANPPSEKPKAANFEHKAGYGLGVYNEREYPLQTGGNVYMRGAAPYFDEKAPLILQDIEPLQVNRDGASGKVSVEVALPAQLKHPGTVLVTTELLGKALIPGVAYENANGSPIKIDTDYFGKKRDEVRPTAGPFENLPAAGQPLLVR